jgi:U3 small nucleolar RNA-associated protein 19
VQKVFQFLSGLAKVPLQDAYCQGSMTGLKQEKTNSSSVELNFKKHFQETWLSLMRFPMTALISQAILESLHQDIIPSMSEPVLLMDFLVDAYNAGGYNSLLALNGLFTLIHEHNLDYPNFYTKLYALFDANLLHSKYRSRFFRLVELFLSST